MFSSYVDRKYINLISCRLPRFRWQSGRLANCRCIICGDSETNKSKARFYLYEKEGRFHVKCHNCSYSHTFTTFLKQMDPSLYSNYNLEVFGTKEQVAVELQKPSSFNVEPGAFKLLQKCSALDNNSICKKYLLKRKIPSAKWDSLYYTSAFMDWTNLIVPDKFDEDHLKYDGPRLLIPCMKNDKMHAFTGRALQDDKVKYILIVLDASIPSIYGLDKVDFNYWSSVTEGPIDAMFLKNSLATCGGDIHQKLWSFPQQHIRIIYDNEPRSKQTVAKLYKAIYGGFNVMIWPKNITQNDVNDCILAGYSAEYLEQVFFENTFKGLMAELKLKEWAK